MNFSEGGAAALPSRCVVPSRGTWKNGRKVVLFQSAWKDSHETTRTGLNESCEGEVAVGGKVDRWWSGVVRSRLPERGK